MLVTELTLKPQQLTVIQDINVYISSLVILSLSEQLNIDVIVQEINSNNIKNLACADMLHLFKTFRTKFLSLTLTLFPYNTEHIFNYSIIDSFISQGKETSDCTHIGKMRDSYVLSIFSLSNLNSLIKERQWNAIIFFLPWCLWLTSITNTLYTPSCRVFMLKVTFEFVKRFYNIMKSPKAMHEDVSQSARKVYVPYVTLPVLERIIPTLAVIISDFEKYIALHQEDESFD